VTEDNRRIAKPLETKQHPFTRAVNHRQVSREVKKKKIHTELNKNENAASQNLWDARKAVQKGNL